MHSLTVHKCVYVQNLCAYMKKLCSPCQSNKLCTFFSSKTWWRQKSSTDLYRDAVQILGMSCTLSDSCRCLDCQVASHAERYVYRVSFWDVGRFVLVSWAAWVVVGI